MFAERGEHAKVCDCNHSEGNRGKQAVLCCRLNGGRRSYNCLQNCLFLCLWDQCTG